MYGKYVLKRAINGIAIYVILIFIYSILFNVTMEATVRSQIEEVVRAEVMSMSNSTITPAEITRYGERRKLELYTQYKLDKPVGERILFRALNTLTFQYGNSTIIKSSSGSNGVMDIVLEAVPKTLILFSTAMIIDIIIGLWLGIKKAQKPGKTLDKSTSVVTMIVFGMPSWWLGMLMIMFFAYIVKIFPSGGLHSTPAPEGFAYFLDSLYHLTLPVITLVILGFWGRAFLTRNIVLGVLQEDFIMSARARGIPERKVLYGHAMRTAAPPIVTMSLLALLTSVSGNIVFETIFSWTGMGNLYWVSVQQNDVPVLLGNLSFTTGLFISGLVILDLIYGFLDPRIKVGGKA